eukprot:SAG22_NODE_7159_length_770_cov_0.994039_1_plen_73_part_00
MAEQEQEEQMWAHHHSVVLNADRLNLCCVVRFQPFGIVRIHVEQLAAVAELLRLRLHRRDLLRVGWVVLFVP